MALDNILNRARPRALILPILAAVALAACNGSNDNSTRPTDMPNGAVATATPKASPSDTPYSTPPRPGETHIPQGTATPGQIVQGTPGAEYKCPGVTEEYIRATGQEYKLTAPVLGCVDAEWFAVPVAPPSADRLQKAFGGTIAYTVPRYTEIYAPLGGILTITESNENGVFGSGVYGIAIRNGDNLVSISLHDAELAPNVESGTFAPRGTFIAWSGTAFPQVEPPSELRLEGASVLLWYGPNKGPKFDLSDPVYWVDGIVGTSPFVP